MGGRLEGGSTCRDSLSESYLVGNPEDRFSGVEAHIRWEAGKKVDLTCTDNNACLNRSYFVGNLEDRFSPVQDHIR